MVTDSFGTEMFQRSLLLILMWREARGDGLEAMRAVGHVVRNRKLAWNKDWDIVIDTHFQFSSISVLGDSQTVLWPTMADATNLYGVVDAIFEGSDSDTIQGALYYANEHLDIQKTSPWYFSNIISSPDHPILATIGKQTFRK